MKKITVLAFVLSLLSISAFAADAKVYFISPKDGATVGETVHVKFGLKGMKVHPAGQDATDKTSGHHHLLIDSQPIPEGQVVPSDETHLHFGKGQTEADIKLPKGKHRLTLQFADGAHRSFGEKMSASINVTVK